MKNPRGIAKVNFEKKRIINLVMLLGIFTAFNENLLCESFLVESSYLPKKNEGTCEGNLFFAMPNELEGFYLNAEFLALAKAEKQCKPYGFRQKSPWKRYLNAFMICYEGRPDVTFEVASLFDCSAQ